MLQGNLGKLLSGFQPLSSSELRVQRCTADRRGGERLTVSQVARCHEKEEREAELFGSGRFLLPVWKLFTLKSRQSCRVFKSVRSSLSHQAVKLSHLTLCQKLNYKTHIETQCMDSYGALHLSSLLRGIRPRRAIKHVLMCPRARHDIYSLQFHGQRGEELSFRTAVWDGVSGSDARHVIQSLRLHDVRTC